MRIKFLNDRYIYVDQGYSLISSQQLNVTEYCDSAILSCSFVSNFYQKTGQPKFIIKSGEGPGHFDFLLQHSNNQSNLLHIPFFRRPLLLYSAYRRSHSKVFLKTGIPKILKHGMK